MLLSQLQHALEYPEGDKGPDPCRLVIRCAGAYIRRYTALAPERSAAMLHVLVSSVREELTAWQRFLVFQALRPLMQDAELVYRRGGERGSTRRGYA